MQPQTDEDIRDDDLDDDEGPGTELAPQPQREVKEFVFAFDAPATKPFTLVFHNDGTGHEERHEFEAVADAGAGGMLAVSSLIRYDPRGRQMVDLNAMLTFFERVLVDGDYERLKDLLDRKDLIISMDQLGEVFNWLVEGYTGRPTRPSSGSAGSRRDRGRSSKAKRR